MMQQKNQKVVKNQPTQSGVVGVAPSRIMWGAVFLALAGCGTVQPVAISDLDIESQAKADRVEAANGVEAMAAPLSLDEALARALKYNLDRRVKMLEEGLALNQLDVTQLDMLPKLMANAGYSSRDNELLRRSRNSSDGTLSTSTFISQDRAHTLSDLSLTWSMLDFGMGYINAQQQADRVLIAAEKRRKAMHLLMQDVRIAYWRAASAEKLRNKVLETVRLAEEALADARAAEQARIRSPLDSMRYQRQVLENLRLLEAIDQELSAAHIDLALLINAPIGQRFKISEPGVMADRAALDAPIEVMEEIAMMNNPDILEQHYNARIAREEIRKTMLRMFPNITFSYGPKYDTDSYLLNNRWNETGLQVSLNLFNLFTSQTQRRLTEAGVKLADQRRVAVQMAVIAQVHLARQQFANALSQYERAEVIWQTDNRISEQVTNRAAVQVQSKLDRVSSDTAALLSELRRYQAMAQVYSTEARLQATLGIEPEIGSVSQGTLRDLQKQVSMTTSVSAVVAQRIAEAKAIDAAQAASNQAAQAAATAEAEVPVRISALENAQEQAKLSSTKLERSGKQADKQNRVLAQAQQRLVDLTATESRLKAELVIRSQAALTAKSGHESALAEIVTAQQEVDQKGQVLTQQKAAFEVASKARDDARTALSEADKRNDVAERALRDANYDLDKSQSNLRSALRQVERAKSRLAVRETDLMEAKSVTTQAEQALAAAEEDGKEKAERAVQRAQSRQADRQVKVDQAQADLKVAEAEQKLAEDTVKAMTEKAGAAKQQSEQAQLALAQAKSQLEATNQARKQADQAVDVAASELSSAQGRLKEANRQADRARDKWQDAVADESKAQQRVAVAEKERAEGQVQFDAEQATANQLQTELAQRQAEDGQANATLQAAQQAKIDAEQRKASTRQLADESKKRVEDMVKSRKRRV